LSPTQPYAWICNVKEFKLLINKCCISHSDFVDVLSVVRMLSKVDGLLKVLKADKKKTMTRKVRQMTINGNQHMHVKKAGVRCLPSSIK